MNLHSRLQKLEELQLDNTAISPDIYTVWQYLGDLPYLRSITSRNKHVDYEMCEVEWHDDFDANNHNKIVLIKEYIRGQ